MAMTPAKDHERGAGGQERPVPALEGLRLGLPHDAITDITGLRVGHWTDAAAATGCTVLLGPPEGMTAAVAVLGGAPGTRETDVLAPGNSVEKAHAIVLTGGSAFGLEAASGVMRWLRAQDIGFPMRGGVRVPIVPAAVIYDLGTGSAEVWPDADAGVAACLAAREGDVPRGSVGAGAGATVAKLAGPERALKGGLGTASDRHATGITVGALVAVNAVGEIVDPATGRAVAPVLPKDGRPLSALTHLRSRRLSPPGQQTNQLGVSESQGSAEPPATANTTIAVVATDLALDRAQLLRLALMAHAGIARTIRPSHTPADGDTVFAVSTGRLQPAGPVDLVAVGALAARALERAILDGVRLATPLAGVPAVSFPSVRPLGPAERAWLPAFMTDAWGAETVVSRGRIHSPAELPGFVARWGDAVAGVVTMHRSGDDCEIVTLNAVVEGAGIGRALLVAAEGWARAHGCRRLWLVTTNDNMRALDVYQRFGMQVAAWRSGAVDEERALKPEIPLTGLGGIAIRDEVELAKVL